MSYRQPMVVTARPVGELLRDWRQRRRLSQLELAGDADVSTRHLSFVETGRSTPSREMVLRLAERLEVPLRERNLLLLAAGYAPAFPERPLWDPALAGAREAIELLLAGHEPYPALVIDRHWTLIASNRAVGSFLHNVAPALLQPPVNVLRLSLHPDGVAPRITNLPEWREHVLARLRRQVELAGDPTLVALLAELRGYPAPGDDAACESSRVQPAGAEVIVPLQIASDAGTLSFISTTTVFGTPVDITLSELALETFLPADPETAAALRRLAAEPEHDRNAHT